MKKQLSIKKPSRSPVNINKDVWFYESAKSLYFVVWSPKRQTVVNFRLPLKKIKATP